MSQVDFAEVPILDRTINALPLYRQVKRYLLQCIRRSQEGDQIPPEAFLCSALGVSRQTIRQAMNELDIEGYVERAKGRGTFVRIPKVQRDSRWAFEDYNREMNEYGLLPRTRLIAVESIPAPMRVVDRLGIEIAQEVLFVRRLRYADSWPLMVVDSYLPYLKASSLRNRAHDLENRSLHELIEEVFCCTITRAFRSVEAIPGPEVECRLLGVATDSPLLYSETIRFDENDTPVEYATAWYRGDRSRFTMEFRKSSN